MHLQAPRGAGAWAGQALCSRGWYVRAMHAVKLCLTLLRSEERRLYLVRQTPVLRLSWRLLHGMVGIHEECIAGERMLHRCLDQRPDCVEARMLLIENVMAQGRSVCWH